MNINSNLVLDKVTGELIGEVDLHSELCNSG